MSDDAVTDSSTAKNQQRDIDVVTAYSADALVEDSDKLQQVSITAL
jgi:hypothetical protein